MSKPIGKQKTQSSMSNMQFNSKRKKSYRLLILLCLGFTPVLTASEPETPQNIYCNLLHDQVCSQMRELEPEARNGDQKALEKISDLVYELRIKCPTAAMYDVCDAGQ